MRKIHTLESVNAFVVEKYGGTCTEIKLKPGPNGVNAKYGNFQCASAHVWTASLGAVLGKKPSWCRECINISIKDANDEAVKHGGICLSDAIKTSAERLEWRCMKNHQWFASYSNVARGNWCRKCTHAKRTRNIPKLNEILLLNDGKCHSEYVNCNTQMKFECNRGHIWTTVLRSVIENNTWCPHCANKSESDCREIFEQLFETQFPRVRPDWLRNPEGNKIELDGFCPELAIPVAFEFNGSQHYHLVDWIHNTEEDLKKQQLHDAIKVEECAKRGITLIVIPYTVKKYKDKCEFIVRMLQPTHPNIDINKIKLYKA